MKLNILVMLLLTFFTSNAIYTQNKNACQKVVELTIDAINMQSTTELKKQLSPQFRIAGQEGEIAIMVLDQLIPQLNEKVESHSQTSVHTVTEGLEVKYLIEYSGMGAKEATFLFNSSNQLLHLELFEMEVKKMCNASSINPPTTQSIVEIPFKLVGNLIVVQVELNGQMQDFLLDSGSPLVILNSRYVEDESSGKTTLSNSQGVNGNISGMNITSIESMDFHGLTMPKQEMITMDMTHIEDEIGRDIYGIIGYDMLKNHDILYNYEAKTITLIDPANSKQFISENWSAHLIEIVAIEWNDHIPVVKVQIGNNDFELGIDCGAESNLLDVMHWNNVEAQLKNVRSDTLNGADNNPIEITVGDIKETLIGRLSFLEMPSIFSDISHLNDAYGLSVDGLLGYPMLSVHPTLISVDRSELLILHKR